MARKRVFVVVGAGASMDFGFPDTAQLSKTIWKHVNPLLSGGGVGFDTDITLGVSRRLPFHEVIWDRRETISPPTVYESHAGYNFEAWWGALIHWLGTSAHQRHATFGDEDSKIANLDHKLWTYSERYYLRLRNELLSAHHAYIGEHRDGDLGRRLALFCGRLRDLADIVIVNLNYDSVLDDALEVTSKERGFVADNGVYERFDTHKFFASRESSHGLAMLHLHGSLHLWVTPDGRSLEWGPIGPEQDARSVWRYDNSRKKQVITYPLVSGRAKELMLTQSPFREYLAVAVREAHRADAILTIGYSGGDFHVDGLLDAAMASARGLRVDITKEDGRGTERRYVGGFKAFLEDADAQEKMLATLISAERPREGAT